MKTRTALALVAIGFVFGFAWSALAQSPTPIIVSATPTREIVFIPPEGSVRCALFMAGDSDPATAIRADAGVGPGCAWIPKPAGLDGWGALVELRCQRADASWSEPALGSDGVPRQITAFPYLPGDVNEDGELDELDATIIRRTLAGFPVPMPPP